MKNKAYIFILAAAIMSVSCSDFLDESLKGSYTAENYYTTSDKAQMAVNAVYNSLYNNILWIFGDVASDDSVKGGDDGDQPQINNIDLLNASADNGSLGTFWQDTYETIARANNVIANIPGMELEDAVKNQYLGEAKFLRAYSYFNLVNIFGSVPLKLKSQNTAADIHVGLSSVSEIYKQIDADLTDAADGLTDTKTGRANRSAALALLAKSKLFQGDWNGALEAITKFETVNAGYSLEPVYADLFCSGGENSVESIFAIRYSVGSTASLGNNLNVWFSP